MGTIRVLDPVTVTKIAAGEVIDRPASIVKELIENSLDSGATRIVVETDHGGKRLIRVTDNGSGISREDLPLAPVRHATSKIQQLEDIYGSLGYGFRGEALASMAHVGKVMIQSKPEAQEVGFKLSAFHDRIDEPQPQSCASGTTVEVRDLFWDMPVRQKFLKSETTEAAYIYDVVLQGALAYPHIDWVLKHNGQEQLNTTGVSDVPTLVRILFGKDWLSHLIPIQTQVEGIVLSGWMSSPALTFPNRSKQWFWVNRRHIRNAMFQKAVQHVFQDRIPHGRYPFLMLNLELPGKDVDVNVHPQKLDVKFLNSGVIFDVIKQGVSLSLTHSSHPEAGLKIEPQPVGGYTTDYKPFESSFSSESHQPFSPDSLSLFSAQDWQQSAQAPSYLQLFNTYIVLKLDDGLAVLDQHAVHERILYDKFKEAYEQNRVTQPLLIAHYLTLTQEEMALLETMEKTLATIGLEYEPFGPSQVVIRSIPSEWQGENLDDMMALLLEEIKTEPQWAIGAPVPIEALQLKACKAAIKAGKPMTELDVKSMLEDLVKTPSKYTCPHGRPLCVILGKPELEKLFLRR